MYTFGLIGLGRVTKVLINARIERSSYEHLRRVAEEKGITVSQAVREAIGSHLSRTKKTPDQIRFDILQDDRRRYIGELELEGFRVIDISEIVYDGLEVKPPSLTPENNYIMILDKNRSSIWIETPPPIICKGSFQLETEEGVRFINLLDDVFDTTDFDRTSEVIQRKLADFIKEQKESGDLQMILETEPRYLESYRSTGAAIDIVLKTKHRLDVKEEYKGTTIEEALDRAWSSLKDVILRGKYSKEERRLLRSNPRIVTFDLIKDKLWFISPDEYSSQKILGFSSKQEEDFQRYLGAVWNYYFSSFPFRAKLAALEGVIIILKLSQHLGLMIDEAVKVGNAESADDAVYRAIQEWCDRLKAPGRSISVGERRPRIKRAMQEGIYGNPREVVEKALDLLESALSRQPSSLP